MSLLAGAVDSDDEIDKKLEMDDSVKSATRKHT